MTDKAATATTTTEPKKVTVADDSDPLHDEVVRRAVDLSWNNEISAAEALLQPGAATIPRHALHLAELHWCSSLVSGNEKLMLEVLEQLNGTLRLTEACLADYPASCVRNGLLRADSSAARVADLEDDLNIVLADANLLSAAIMVLTSQKIKGAWRVRKAWTIYYGLERRKKRPVCAELQGSVAFGCGLIMFGISWLPAMMVSICRVVGFESNRIRGMALLQDACAEHGVRSPLAALVLLVFSLIVPHSLSNLDELLRVAKPVLDDALARWPQGMMFNWLASYYTKKIGDVAGTLRYVDAAIAACLATGKFAAPPATLAVDRVSCLFLAQKFDDACRACDELMANGGGTCIVRGICHTYRALCLHMVGRTADAVAEFQSVRTLKCHTKDRLFIDMGLSAIKTRASGLTLIPYEVMYIKRDIAHMTPATATSFLALLERQYAPFASKASTEETAVYQLIAGVLRRATGDRDRGNSDIRTAAAAAVAAKGFKHEKFVAPFACCEIAEIAYHDNNLDECARYLDLANKYGGGPFEDFIKPRVRIGRETLKARIANGGKEPPVSSRDAAFATSAVGTSSEGSADSNSSGAPASAAGSVDADVQPVSATAPAATSHITVAVEQEEEEEEDE